MKLIIRSIKTILPFLMLTSLVSNLLQPRNSDSQILPGLSKELENHIHADDLKELQIQKKWENNPKNQERRLNATVVAIAIPAAEQAINNITSLVSEHNRGVILKIENNSSLDLIYIGQEVISGTLTDSPSSKISPGEASIIGGFSKFGFYGTEVKLFYQWGEWTILIYWDIQFAGKNYYGAELKKGNDKEVSEIESNRWRVIAIGEYGLKMYGTAGNQANMTLILDGLTTNPQATQSMSITQKSTKKLISLQLNKCVASDNQYVSWFEENLQSEKCNFEVINNNDGTYSFKNSQGKLLSGKDDGRVNMVDKFGPWEKWIVVYQTDLGFGYIKSVHETYLSAMPDGFLFLKPETNEWERFNIID